MIYIVGTPLGNLQDLSVRQAKTILSAEFILCEDTRTAGILVQQILKLFDIPRETNQRFISYHKENEFQKLHEVLNLVSEGKNIALISEAGLPLISDPGNLLVAELVKRQMAFTVIPGPTAASTALLNSGLDFRHFLFYGFLPKSAGDVKKTFELTRTQTALLKKTPVIFYESPLRINKSLEVLDFVDSNAQVSVSRELTKVFEETIRGTASELKKKKYKGEIVLVVLFSPST